MAGGCVLLAAGRLWTARLAFWSLAGSPGGELLAQIKGRLSSPHQSPFPPADELLP